MIIEAVTRRGSGGVMSVLLEVPVGNGASLLVETDRAEIPGGLTMASPSTGAAAAKARQSLSEALQQLEPMLSTVRERLVSAGSEQFAVEFGIRLAGETGCILAKGTAEVNLKVTMTWKKDG
jgi:Trypsin-co-occurring domain 1